MSIRSRSRFRRATRMLRRTSINAIGWRFSELRRLIRAAVVLVDKVEDVLEAADHHDEKLVVKLAERELKDVIVELRAAVRGPRDRQKDDR